MLNTVLKICRYFFYYLLHLFLPSVYYQGTQKDLGNGENTYGAAVVTCQLGVQENTQHCMGEEGKSCVEDHLPLCSGTQIHVRLNVEICR